MKNQFKIVTFVLISLLFVSCAKIPFKEVEPLKSTSLINVYVVNNVSASANEADANHCYKIAINGKNLEECAQTDEFLQYNGLLSEDIILSATRADIEKQTLKLNLKEGETYYLRIKSFSNSFNKFEFVQVKKTLALNEIKDMTQANPPEKENASLELFKESKKESKNLSKSDEIKKAHQLKVDGLLTQEEYNKLKAEILAK